MGVVDRVGENVKNLKPGQRVVASFQIACGQCGYCKQKLSSMCDKTNNSSYVVSSEYEANKYSNKLT
jgi:threonine dehydrogenase-like Zn-dependent dehydrogenase